jgi:hypothetical protein
MTVLPNSNRHSPSALAQWSGWSRTTDKVWHRSVQLGVEIQILPPKGPSDEFACRNTVVGKLRRPDHPKQPHRRAWQYLHIAQLQLDDAPPAQ